MSPRFLPKIVWYQRVWRPSPSHLSQRGSRWQLRGRRQVMGFSLLLKIIMPLQGHTDSYDTTFSSSSPLVGASFTSGVRTAAAHTVWHAKTRRGLVALLPSHPWTVALVSRREGIFVFPVTGQSTQEGDNCSQGEKNKKKKEKPTPPKWAFLTATSSPKWRLYFFCFEVRTLLAFPLSFNTFKTSGINKGRRYRAACSASLGCVHFHTDRL